MLMVGVFVDEGVVGLDPPPPPPPPQAGIPTMQSIPIEIDAAAAHNRIIICFSSVSIDEGKRSTWRVPIGGGRIQPFERQLLTAAVRGLREQFATPKVRQRVPRYISNALHRPDSSRIK